MRYIMKMLRYFDVSSFSSENEFRGFEVGINETQTKEWRQDTCSKIHMLSFLNKWYKIFKMMYNKPIVTLIEPKLLAVYCLF